jgi:hypothetical protein
LDEIVAWPREHAITIVGPGDVGFLTVEKFGVWHRGEPPGGGEGLLGLAPAAAVSRY